MNVLKGIGLALLSLILFISLIAFGVGYTVSSVPLNPHYYARTLNNVNISQTVEDAFNKGDLDIDISANLQTEIFNTLKKTEPVIKKRINIFIEDILTYVKNKKSTTDLRSALSDSFVNTDFIAELLENIDVSNLISEAAKQQDETGDDSTEIFTDSLISTIDSIEPSFKEQIVNLSNPIFKYLLSETAAIDLKTEIRNTLLSNEFLTEVINKLDLTDIISDILKEEIGEELPGAIDYSEKIDSLAVTAEPYFKQQLSNAASDIADYVLGIKSDLNITLNIDTAIPNLKTVAKEVYMEQLPSYLQGASQSVIDQEFEKYYADFRQTIPASLSFSSDDLGTELPDDITEMLAELQTGLEDARASINDVSNELEENLEPARSGVGIFNLVYILVIVVGLLTIAGIILIYRSVKEASLHLGIIFAVYGVIVFAGVLVTRAIVSNLLAGVEEIPTTVIPVTTSVLNDMTSPHFIFSLICLIVGILLVVASTVYPRLRTSKLT